MKNLIALTLTLVCAFAHATNSEASLRIGVKQVSTINYDEITKLDVDMDSLVNASNREVCYEGDIRQAAKIAEAVLDIGTGDSTITSVSTSIQNDLLTLQFEWYGEDGDHMKKLNIGSCQ